MSASSLNLSIILTFRDIANLIECGAMFYFRPMIFVRLATKEPGDNVAMQGVAC